VAWEEEGWPYEDHVSGVNDEEIPHRAIYPHGANGEVQTSVSTVTVCRDMAPWTLRSIRDGFLTDANLSPPILHARNQSLLLLVVAVLVVIGTGPRVPFIISEKRTGEKKKPKFIGSDSWMATLRWTVTRILPPPSPPALPPQILCKKAPE